MITAASFRKALMAMGFHTANNDLLVKSFPVGCSMQVDFQSQKLVFPTAIEGRDRNNGFDKPENFVVFECVCRLLEKGYRPEHIELEKEWHLGHDAKSGRADICVYDNKRQSMLFIIECKTWGKQFDKAWKDTKSDGGQVFSYWQQERSCQWLIVYTSDYGDHGIVYKAPTIHCQDDANIVKMAKKDKSLKLLPRPLNFNTDTP